MQWTVNAMRPAGATTRNTRLVLSPEKLYMTGYTSGKDSKNE
jgi:hypothetical protein